MVIINFFKKFFIAMIVCLIFVSLVSVFVVKMMGIERAENKKTFVEIQAQNLNQNDREKRIAELERRAVAIRSFQDVINLEGGLSKIDGGDSTSEDFLRIENMVVKAIANLITVGDHKQMKSFIKASRYKSTNNLLIITFFDNKKLSDSKKDIVFGANLLGGYEREDLYHDFFNRKRVQELLLDKILESPDVFSTIEILDLFRMISLKKERIASFLDQYIGEVRPTKALVVNK